MRISLCDFRLTRYKFNYLLEGKKKSNDLDVNDFDRASKFPHFSPIWRTEKAQEFQNPVKDNIDPSRSNIFSLIFWISCELSKSILTVLNVFFIHEVGCP